ncbi:discoidin domain-containing protein [Kutzneria sp. NPDC052558]|uniref:discoidin domain-containing protein n=1 Tax=Kutzneria sp. NPDC052558 TaxID=3364121 RepID=UPI0037C692C8
MHKTRVAALLTLMALAAGCAQSKVPTDAKVTLTGQLVRQDGAPAGDLKLALTRVPDLGELAFQGIPVAATLGTACLADDPPPLCKLLQRATTDGQGTFTVHMNGSDVQGTFGAATTFDLAAQLPARGSEVDGPSVRASFEIQRTELTVPTLKFWEPDHVTVGGDARTTALDWSRMPDADGYTAHFSVNGQEIWSDTAEATMDSRVFEDANGVVHISAATSAKGPDTTFHLFHTSQGVGFRGRAGAPESRGKPCFAENNKSEPCHLTDGTFDHPLGQSSCAEPCSANGWAYIDLGAPEPVGAVFARANQAGTLTVETSDDATTWTARASGDGQFAALSLPTKVTARYVRVHAAPGSKLTGLTQLSVWP